MKEKQPYFLIPFLKVVPTIINEIIIHSYI